MRKRHFKTPNIRSMTLRADACRRLKSSSGFCGLQCYDVNNSRCCLIQVDVQKVGTAPLPKVVACSAERNEK